MQVNKSYNRKLSSVINNLMSFDQPIPGYYKLLKK